MKCIKQWWLVWCIWKAFLILCLTLSTFFGHTAIQNGSGYGLLSIFANWLPIIMLYFQFYGRIADTNDGRYESLSLSCSRLCSCSIKYWRSATLWKVSLWFFAILRSLTITFSVLQLVEKMMKIDPYVMKKKGILSTIKARQKLKKEKLEIEERILKAVHSWFYLIWNDFSRINTQIFILK